MTFEPANSSNSANDPISQWIEQLSAADPQAAERLWGHFCRRLMVFARGRLKATTRRVYDEEDAALSAFKSLCRGIEAQRFPDVADRDNLWTLLVVITSRKILNRHRYDDQHRRSVGRTLSDSLLHTSESGINLLNAMPSREPTPEFSAEVADTSEHLLNLLPEADLKSLVLLKLEGHTNEEVAEQMQLTRRTVQRKLERIRRIWLESAELSRGIELPE